MDKFAIVVIHYGLKKKKKKKKKKKSDKQYQHPRQISENLTLKLLGPAAGVSGSLTVTMA